MDELDEGGGREGEERPAVERDTTCCVSGGVVILVDGTADGDTTTGEGGGKDTTGTDEISLSDEATDLTTLVFGEAKGRFVATE